jgi:hypothetical protein
MCSTARACTPAVKIAQSQRFSAVFRFPLITDPSGSEKKERDKQGTAIPMLFSL